ncbi:MAG: hypothetical protein K6F58_07145 [Bacteroidales bacterium]|nr:hypothetical protein [Bacteroidales bacterium]
MKKLAFSLVLLAGFALGAAAQENAFNRSVSLSLGGVTGLDARGLFQDNSNPYTLSGVYEPTWSNPIYYPVVSLDGDWILSRRIGISLSLSYSSLKAEKLDGVTRESMGFSYARQLCLVPGFRVYWANKERFKLYSGAGIGAELCWITEEGKPERKFGATWDILPLGVRFKLLDGFGLYVFGEGMFGTRLIGYRLGVGYAF